MPFRPPGSGSSGPPRVLVVDDDDALRSALSRVLARAGFAVEETGDPRRALDRLARGGPPVAVVVCDVVMPLMNGVVFGERVRSVAPGTRLLYMSGLAEESALRDWGIPASTPFLAKPVEADALVAAVTELVAADPDAGAEEG